MSLISTDTVDAFRLTLLAGVSSLQKTSRQLGDWDADLQKLGKAMANTFSHFVFDSIRIDITDKIKAKYKILPTLEVNIDYAYYVVSYKIRVSISFDNNIYDLHEIKANSKFELAVELYMLLDHECAAKCAQLQEALY